MVGSLAVCLCTAMPLYSWTHSLWQNPFSTVKNVLDVAFDEAVGGLSGLWSTEVRGSCFSFAYRVNTVAPYTAVFPGGILGDIMKGLVRSYLLVFHHAFVSFKGIFAFLIAIICKTGIVQAAINALKPLYSLLKRGRRGLQALKSKTFGKIAFQLDTPNLPSSSPFSTGKHY